MSCKATSIDFIVRDSDPHMKAIEDDIRKSLEAIGITVKTHFLTKEEYSDAELNGDYHLLFSRTWGAPYDPHSYMTSWAVPSHVEYSAIGNLTPPLTREVLLQKIENVQTELDEVKIAAQWQEIMEDVHAQALFVPLWGSRIPYVVNRRLVGFVPSQQAYSIPVSTIQVASGSTNVTVAPGVGGLFKSIGPINPHQYAPNELWAQDWIYEGLVSYGQDGEIVPALATSWKVEADGAGQKATFKLREGVKFHDGADWNCAAAVLNFNHVLSDVVRQRHQWFGAGKYLESWTCNGDYELILKTSSPFYPLLQELTYIRPLRFASPKAFANEDASHPVEHNSCNPGDFGSKWDFLEEDVTCLGLKAPVGTGPFKYVSREVAADGSDAKVVFEGNEDYWSPQKPGIKYLTVVQYESTTEVEAALMSDELDMALGIGPLDSKQVHELKFRQSDKFDVSHSDIIQHSLLVFNGNKSPTNDKRVRQAIIHAIDKNTFLKNEFYGLEEPVTQLLPKNAPYCNVDLSPKWGYDVEKAKFLNCPSSQPAALNTGAIVGIVIGSVTGIALIAFITHLIKQEKAGKPLFAPVKGSNVEMT